MVTVVRHRPYLQVLPSASRWSYSIFTNHRTVAAVYLLRLRAVALALRGIEAARCRACALRTADSKKSGTRTQKAQGRTQKAQIFLCLLCSLLCLLCPVPEIV